MGQWLTMKILGFLKDPLFYLRILATCSVLSTGLLIRSQVNNTSDANISGRNVNQREEREELPRNPTGSDIMDLAPSSKKISNYWERNPSPEKYFLYTQPLVR